LASKLKLTEDLEEISPRARAHLGITPIKVDGTYYISYSDLESLDQLDRFLKTPGAKMADFSKGEITKINPVVEAEIIEQSTPEFDLTASASVIQEIIVTTINALSDKLNPTNPIGHWEKLKIAAQEKFILSSAEIKSLLGVKPSLKKGEATWQRGSFVFTPVGKIGNQTAWKVDTL